MGLFDFFRKKKAANKLSIFDDEDFLYSADVIKEQNATYHTLSDSEKAAILIIMGSFRQVFILENTYQREYIDDLVSIREEAMNMTYCDAQKLIMNGEDALRQLSNIKNKNNLDYLLQDMKYMLKKLVSLSIRFRDGAEVNRNAINTLYNIFMPLGYEKHKIHDPREYMMF